MLSYAVRVLVFGENGDFNQITLGWVSHKHVRYYNNDNFLITCQCGILRRHRLGEDEG